MDFDLDSIKQGIDLLRSGFGLMRAARDALPEGDKRDQLDQTLENAERQLQIAEAQIAKGFDYQLCQCTFPPQIMLSIGIQKHRERFQCPRCQKVWPDPTPINPPSPDDDEGSWIRSRG